MVVNSGKKKGRKMEKKQDILRIDRSRKEGKDEYTGGRRETYLETTIWNKK